MLTRFLNEAVIGNSPGLKVEGESELALQSVEVIQADLGPLGGRYLQFVEDFFHTAHRLYEILAIELNDLTGDLPGLLEVRVIEISQIRIEDLMDIEGGAALYYWSFISC